MSAAVGESASAEWSAPEKVAPKVRRWASPIKGSYSKKIIIGNIKPGIVHDYIDSFIEEKSPQGSAVVLYQVKTSTRPTDAVIGAIRAGLPFRELSDLQEGLGMTLEQLAPRLGISTATLHRRKVAKKLDPQESDRVVRFARLLRKGIEVFGTADYARQWLGCPQAGLGGAIPLDYAETELGAREVEDLLVRIDQGVYS